MSFEFKWIRVVINICWLFIVLFLAFHHKTTIYLLRQGKGQLELMFRRQTVQEFIAGNTLSARELENLSLVEKIKNYSVDSLGYRPTDNFSSVFDQGNSPTLWVITASEPYDIKAFEWSFPIVGMVSYKGFFKKELAEKESRLLAYYGYDIDVRAVSAWSTLGWFSDPILSSTLKRSKGSFCDLLFHELFHATYYAKSSVDLNENLASFIACKATLRFLANDTIEKRNYEATLADEKIYDAYLLRKSVELKKYYAHIKNSPSRFLLKRQKLEQIADSVQYLPIENKDRFLKRKKTIFSSKNACFIDVAQYDSKQDSMERVFNKIYTGNIKKLVQDLTSNKINY